MDIIAEVTEWFVYLTQQQIGDVEDHAEGELGSEEGQKPLGGIHMSLQIKILEVRPQIWELLLYTQNKETDKTIKRSPITHSVWEKKFLFWAKQCSVMPILPGNYIGTSRISKA